MDAPCAAIAAPSGAACWWTATAASSPIGRVLAEAEYLDRRNTRRLLQLIEMADAFDAEASLRPGEFVQYVRKTSIEDAASRCA